MNLHPIHPFDLNEEQMREVQRKLRSQIEIAPLEREPRFVAGADVAYAEPWAFAAIVVMDHASKKMVEVVHHQEQAAFDYVPGLLAFRELPLFLAAWEKLAIEPDLVFFDGNGLLHPERVGIATHASFFIGKPTVGVAKNPFIGEAEEPAPEQGSHAPVWDRGEIIGAAVRTQTRVKPVFVSVGNRIDLEGAIRLTMHYVGKESRVPEITRLADLETKKRRKEWMGNR